MVTRSNTNKYLLLVMLVLVVGVIFFTINDPTGQLQDSEWQNIDGVDLDTNTSQLEPGPDEQWFSHPRYGFSIIVPKDLDIKRYEEGQATETVVFEPKNDDQDLSEPRFQIFVTPYWPSTITEERIKKDIPSGDVREPTEIKIGIHRDQSALMFKSTDALLGETREVWFLKNGYLFEVTASLQHDDWIANILNTWTFQ